MKIMSHNRVESLLPLKRSWLWAMYSLLAVIAGSSNAYAVGDMPVPEISDIGISSQGDYDSVTNWYTYRYVIDNPASNTGDIWHFKIDISQIRKNTARLSSAGLEIPFGSSPDTFDAMLSRLDPLLLLPGTTVVPIGQEAPHGWIGGFGRDGYAGFSIKNDTPPIAPGMSLDGFAIISPGVPTIRAIEVIPNWILVVEDHGEVTEEELNRAGEIEENMVFRGYTLGPANALFLGSYDHWDHLHDDLEKAGALGWFSDTSLLETIKSQLATSREAMDAYDGTLAKILLNDLLNTLNLSTPSQRTREAYDLVRLNTLSLIGNTQDTPIPFEPQLTLTPSTAELPIGAEYTVTATLVNTADNNSPIPGVDINFRVIDGPNSGLWNFAQTDQQGIATFSYIGRRVGTDKIGLARPLASLNPKMMVASVGSLAGFGMGGGRPGGGNRPNLPLIGAEATVTWTGGADLVIPFFSPPTLGTKGGNKFFLSETTENRGSIAAPTSITRYFISDTENINLRTAIVIAEREVPILQPGESSAVQVQEFTIPDGLPANQYFLAACVDASESIIETNETNNCSFSELTRSSSVVISSVVANLPPDCSLAYPSDNSLWPPNHKMVSITINGITDPDGDSVVVRVTGITQDEPVNGIGDGNTSPDGLGIDSTQAQVRSERSGKGNGRVYQVSFTAEDGQGGSCSGAVHVGVPHDLGKGATPIDDGQNYDSTS